MKDQDSQGAHAQVTTNDAAFPGRESRKVSVIIPAYNEEAVVDALYDRVAGVLARCAPEYEILFVDDGSIDRTLEKLEALSKRDFRVKILSFSRNFGHQIALAAGYDWASGDAVICMDADLQHPPELIEMMLCKWQEGYEVVYTIKREITGSASKRMLTWWFYRFFNAVSGFDIGVGAADFRLLDRKVVDALKQFRERFRFYRGLVGWVGFRQIGLEYVPSDRYAGEAKYSLRRMARLALDGLFSFSYLPLQAATVLGALAIILALLYAAYILYVLAVEEFAPQGWASLILVTLFLGGIILIFMGIQGEYIRRIHEEVKDRPLYILKASRGFANPSGDESRLG